ncbi:MAG: AAA domain-containing protein [Niabella sp.]
MPLKRHLIYIDEKDETDRIASWFYRGDKCVVVFRNGEKEYSYNSERIKVAQTGISDSKGYSVFNYLKKIADTVGLKTDEGDNILAKSYQRISFIPQDSILANYLNGTMPQADSGHHTDEIFPFGFNLSQRDAVSKAFSSSMSVIEGPPGTGKTQTILNIIANAVMRGQSVAVVSSNNSATKNVYEKLEKNGIGFIAALLGSTQNKKEFIDSQTEMPDLSAFNLSDQEEAKIKQDVQILFQQLAECLLKKNELALLRQELDNIRTEHLYFKKAYANEIDTSVSFGKNLTADAWLSLWHVIQRQENKRKAFGFIKRLIFRIRYGIKGKSFYKASFKKKIRIVQSEYYPTKITELETKERLLKASLRQFSFDSKMEAYTNLSMQLLKAVLCKRYESKERGIYTIEQLRSSSSEFVRDYPVIMSTTYSLRQSLSDDITYDYVIIDESSQVDLATGVLALSCAKRAVIVGDLKQLPNVVDNLTQEKTDLVFDSFDIPESYRYTNHSLLCSIMEIFPNIPKTLLKEHYRCHPKIIEFCNRKFYHNQLVVLTDQASKRCPLVVHKTVPGNHARERMNQRQIDVIKYEVIPNEKLEAVDLGIVTPYRNQTNALQKAFEGTTIKADTVDKFQGRENQVIILSTVDNEISDFTDNPNRLNVAVSRAIEQLILVVNGNDSEKDGNISDLIRYIKYNNGKKTLSNLKSVFDYLYKGYEERRAAIISKSGRVSEYDSENLMYALIKDVLAEDRFSKYGVVKGYPLRDIVSEGSSTLNRVEYKYATHDATHLDFLIYNDLDKTPVLAIEVDGFAYHKYGTRQEGRDRMKDSILEECGLPLLRFATNGSNERMILTRKLSEIQA